MLHRYRHHPIAFIAHYVRRHGRGHATIVGAIMVAVACNVGISAIIRHLVNGMSEGQQGREAIGVSIVLFCLTIICDNTAWRLAGWTASGVIVRVGGDVRHDLFRYLTGHASTYFADRLSGALAARVSAAAAAVESLENMAAWNLLPAGLNLLLAIATLGTVSPWMALALVAMTMGVGLAIYRLAGRGQSLHLSYAREAAEVDGEMLDVVQNLPLVRAYGMIDAEHARMRQRIGGETGMHTLSLRYMEKLRMIHSFVTAFMTTGLLVWAVVLWRMHRATTGDVVMVTTLGFLILNCTRDFAFSMVEAMKHVTRLSETLDHLLAPHERSGVAETVMLAPNGGRGHVRLRDVSFAYPGGAPVLSHFNLDIPAGARIGWWGCPDRARAPCWPCCSASVSCRKARSRSTASISCNSMTPACAPAWPSCRRMCTCCAAPCVRISAMAAPMRPRPKSGRRRRPRAARVSSRPCRPASIRSWGNAG